jgi:uncharacterized LabA/DUF88 family protein
MNKTKLINIPSVLRPRGEIKNIITKNIFKLETKGRTMLFIDAANILYSQKDLGWYVDYSKLIKYFEKYSNFSGAYYYTGKVGTLEKQVSFLNKLTEMGFIVKAKEVKMIKLGGGKMLPKGNLDVELALDAYRLNDKYDTIVLFSGDSDFNYLLDLLKEKKKQILIVSTRGHVSKELLVAGKYIDLNKLKQYIEYKNQKTPIKGSSKCDKDIIAKK